MISISMRKKPKDCAHCEWYRCWGECAVCHVEGEPETLYQDCPIHEFDDSTQPEMILAVKKYKEGRDNDT